MERMLSSGVPWQQGTLEEKVPWEQGTWQEKMGKSERGGCKEWLGGEKKIENLTPSVANVVLSNPIVPSVVLSDPNLLIFSFIHFFRAGLLSNIISTLREFSKV
jgi:hypothetical protein